LEHPKRGCDATEAAEQKLIPPEIRMGALRQMVAFAAKPTLAAEVVLAGRLDIAANCVLPCVFYLPEFDNVFGCVRWPVGGDGVHDIQTDNAYRPDVDCSEP
jgi:hypothetical protein